MTGALTVRRFRVEGALPSGWRDTFRDRLDEHAFQEPPTGIGKEAIEGWVQVHNLLDTAFDDFNRWLYNDVALFALRVDKKTLPAKLFQATVAKKCDAWCKEHGVQHCPPGVKGELKDALEAEWLRRTLPRVTVVEAAWHIAQGSLLLHSLSDNVADRFSKRFFRTFGMKLVPFSPLDWVDADARDGLLASVPLTTGGVH